MPPRVRTTELWALGSAFSLPDGFPGGLRRIQVRRNYRALGFGFVVFRSVLLIWACGLSHQVGGDTFTVLNDRPSI